MRKLIICFILIGILSGCNGWRNGFQHFKSNTIGIKRTVILYANDGNEIKRWEINSVVEDKGGTIQFLNKDGKLTTVAGTFIVE